MTIALNGTATMYCNLLTDIRIARETGYEAIEIIGAKLYRYLDEGFTISELKPRLEGLSVAAIGFIPDIERREPEEYKALLEETEKMCSLAEKLNCRMVQILTGPLYKDGSYKGHPGMPIKELIKLTAKNLKALADIAKSHDVTFYLEPLNWAHLSSLEDTIELIEEAGQDNVGMVIDFWHMWCTGATAEKIAKLDKKYIKGVHFCDSSEPNGVRSPDHTQPSRQVWTGGGLIPLKEWVNAVKATGFDGWWSPELFSSKHWELDPWQTASMLRDFLEYLLY